MINDPALRWIVTLMFLFSAAVCVSAIARNRHCTANLISHSLHAVMAIAMAVMAWPRGAELPPRAPMIFFFLAAVWFAVVTARPTGHRLANAYHTLMMLGMAWMYAAMGGLSLPRQDAQAAMSMAGTGGHAGHAGHSTATNSGSDAATWVGTMNWLFTIFFAAATVFWFYRFVTARLKGSAGDSSVGVLCQLAMAAGMAIMFAVML